MRSPEEIARYRVEPYVIAADVYAKSPHTGRGGWTWYTGSAGWMYRLIMESLLGLRLETINYILNHVYLRNGIHIKLITDSGKQCTVLR